MCHAKLATSFPLYTPPFRQKNIPILCSLSLSGWAPTDKRKCIKCPEASKIYRILGAIFLPFAAAGLYYRFIIRPLVKTDASTGMLSFCAAALLACAGCKDRLTSAGKWVKKKFESLKVHFHAAAAAAAAAAAIVTAVLYVEI